jgi:hypothetical protein
VDFLVGFTIFILSLIMVANFVPSLLVGLQRTSGIDYDAVAYRTGVVLVEDPGWPAGDRTIGTIYPTDKQPWEQQPLGSIERLGLALTADTPNILSINKINRFFNTTGVSGFNDQFDSSTNDYRRLLLFSTYQYGYNITIQSISPVKPGDPPIKKSIGQPYPAGYGYIRRYVVIKQNTNATINLANFWLPNAFNATEDDQVTQEFRIHLNGTLLYNKDISTHLKIDLQREPTTIRITNLKSVLNNSDPGYNHSPIANNSVNWAKNLAYPNEMVAPVNATLKAIRFYDSTGLDVPGYARMVLKVDGGSGQVVPPTGDLNPPLGVNVNDTVELSVDPLWPSGNVILFDQNPGQNMDIALIFQNDIPHTLITGTFLYDYNKANVTQPVLSTGMLEVGIW